MTEKQLLELVTQLAQWLGLLAYHTRDSRGSQAGFPDLVLAGKGGVIFAELKSDRGRLTGAQQEWRYTLLAAGCQWQQWRPADWYSGHIVAEMKRISE